MGFRKSRAYRERPGIRANYCFAFFGVTVATRGAEFDYETRVKRSTSVGDTATKRYDGGKKLKRCALRERGSRARCRDRWDGYANRFKDSVAL